MAHCSRAHLVRQTVRLAVGLLSGLALLPAYSTDTTAVPGGDSSYEQTVIGSVDSLAADTIDHSLTSIEDLVDRYPNSKLGQLLMADLLAARAGLPDLVDRFADDSLQLSGLRDELRYRWLSTTAQTPAARGLIPANLLHSAPTEQYILAADASHSRLYVFENTGTSYKLVTDYFMTIGRRGMGKLVEGDLRTPEGVYFVTSYLPGDGLPARYGPGAFPINYPNEYDQKMDRTGYGIWIHGTEPENYNRVPLASDGCLSLSNDEFLEIQKYITTDGSTPVIISAAFDWIEPEQKARTAKFAESVVAQWESDWESLDTDRFLSHYSQGEFKNYKQFAARKQAVNQAKSYVEIDLNNLSIYAYPGDQNMMVVSFDQEYRSDNHHSVTQKRQYWKEQQGRWQIIYEG